MNKALLALAVVATLAACGPKGEELYSRAEQALEQGDVKSAVIDLKNLVKDEPKNGKARALLAVALVRNGEEAAAAIEVRKAKDLGAPADELLVAECRVMLAQSEFQQALDSCRPDAVGADAKVEMQIAQGNALLGLERPAEARPQFQAALEARPESLDALLGVAGATYATDGLAAAKSVMEQASAKVKERPAYWMAMGGIGSEGGDLVGAEQSYRNALDAVAKSGHANEKLMALGALAETQMRLGKVEEATATTEQMMKAAPKNPMVQQLRGQVAAAAGDLDEARTLLEDAVASMPENNAARTLLGIVNMRQGNIGQAEMHFQAVLAKQPGNARVQRLLAEARAKAQTPQETLASLQSTLASGAADPTMLAMAGRMSLASGDRAQALEYFTQASTRSGDEQPADVQLEVASGHLMAGDIDRAVELLEKMPAGGATGTQRDFLLMAALLQKGEVDKAVAHADRAVKERGNDPQVRNIAAGVYAAAGRRDEARRQFAEALKLKPDDPATLINLARLDLVEGKPGEARKGFQKVLEADPKNMLATLGMAVASASDIKEAEKWVSKAAAEHPDVVETQLALAQFYMGTREFDKARKVIDEASKKHPDNAALSNARGMVLLGLNDVPGATASLQEAMRLAPKAYGYAVNLARVHAASRNVDAALAVLNDVLKAEPKYVPALIVAATTSLQSGRVESAAGYVERLRQAAPDGAGTHALEGDLAMAQKRYKDAVSSYRKAAAKGGSSQLAVAQFRAAQLAGEPNPDAVLAEWVKKNPVDLNVVTALAEHRRGTGDVAGATDVYETSLAKAPDSVVLLNNLAVLYDLQGNVGKAEEMAARAHKVAPKAPAIADTYGWILFKQGQVDKAAPLIAEAFKGLPGNAEVQYHQAAVLAKRGDKAGAAPLLKKALQGTLPPEQKTEAQKLLNELSQ